MDNKEMHTQNSQPKPRQSDNIVGNACEPFRFLAFMMGLACYVHPLAYRGF